MGEWSARRERVCLLLSLWGSTSKTANRGGQGRLWEEVWIWAMAQTYMGL